MFKVLRNGRVATKARFNSYETARQFVRKQIRKLHTNKVEDAFWRLFSTNPPIGEYGYSIKKD